MDLILVTFNESRPVNREFERIEFCDSPEMVKDLRAYFGGEVVREGSDPKLGHVAGI